MTTCACYNIFSGYVQLVSSGIDFIVRTFCLKSREVQKVVKVYNRPDLVCLCLKNESRNVPIYVANL